MNEKTRKEHIHKRLLAHYNYIETLGYEIIGIFLQGSQNYNLDIYESDYMSDVDTKCIVIPKLEALIKGHKMVSTKYDFENEQIDVKDIRVMMDMWKKQNQSYLEILFTEYKIVNPKYEHYVNEIIKMRDKIVKMNPSLLAKCIKGMSGEKVVALEHEYPSTKEKIKRFGYDPKQLASIIRLTHLIENVFIKKMSFGESIVYNDMDLRKYMIDIKKGKATLAEARKLSKDYDTKTCLIRNNVVEKYGKDSFDSMIANNLEDIVYKLVKFGIISLINDDIKTTFKELHKNQIYFSENDQQTEETIIRELLVEHQNNIFDYYKEE